MNKPTIREMQEAIAKSKGMSDGGSMYESVKNNIPAHVRWFGQTLFGDRSKPFTEKDLTSDEINEINRAIHNSENQKYFKHPGSVGYENYKMPGEGPNLNVESGTTNQPMSMTLGRFSYEKMPDGKVHVTDKYDFDNETRKKDVERYAGEHPVVRALDAGTKALGEALNFNLYGAASTLGNAYIGKDGKPVSITYDPAQTNERYAPDFSGEGSYAQGGTMSLSKEQLEQLRQLRQKIKDYGELENQYDKVTSKIPLKDLESFEAWKAKRGIQHKADGGSMAGVNLYSPLNKSAESIPRTKGTGAEFMTELSKKPGFKKAEVEDRGLEALHGLPKMTKEEFHAHLNSKPIPKINTKIIKDEFGALDTVLYDPDDFRRDRHWVVDRHGEPVTDEPFPTLGHAQEYILDHPELDTKTFHKHYKLPGGDNYQEHLYKYQPEGQKSFVANHGHFGAEPNVLASARTVDRKTPDGKKILHVEEIQSDWHQRGRDEGYKQNLSELPKNYKLEERYIDNKREYLVKDENGRVLSMGLFPESALHNALDNLNNGSRVPNAPFKKNWEEMVAKQLLKHAVDNGYHGIALTSGDEQADRYSLAKQVGQINYMPTTKKLIAYDHSGNPIIHENGVAPEDLDKYVGKEVADKLNKSEWEGSSKVLRGEDIKVGGEGMKSAYDKRIPNIFNDIGKKHGAKMQLHAMPVQKEAKYYAQMHDNGFGVFNGDEDDQLVTNHPNLEKANAKAKELNSTKLHYMDLTPELIEHIKKEGLPIYKKGGNVHVTGDLDTMKYELHMANGGSTLGQIMQPSLSQMKFEMSQRFNPLDIQNVGANEAPNMFPKAYVNPTNKNTDGFVPPGGVATPNGMPIGGVDQNPQQPGQQLTPQQPQQPAQPQGQSGQGVPPTQAPQQQPPMGNMLSLTPEGQAMNAMGGGTLQQPQHLAKGGMAKGESKTEQNPLLVLHNTSAKKLNLADQLGGFAVPSLAISNPNHGFSNFGDISLIGHPEMARPSRLNPVFASDVYSPRFPSTNDEGTKIFRGYTNLGNSRYVPLTLDNAVKEMKGNVRGGEQFGYGAGSVRSGVTPKFSNINEVKKARNKIITDEEFKPLKEESQNKLFELAEKFHPHSIYFGNPFQHTSDFANILQESGKKGLNHIRQYYKETLPEDALKNVQEYLNYLREMPTEYFEAKPQRAVNINEFVGAVIPHHQLEQIKPLLEKHGITRIETYHGKDEKEQKENKVNALHKFSDHFFNYGGKVKKNFKAAKSSDLPRKEPFDKKKFGFADGGMAEGGKQTEKDPQRNAYPGIYDRPDVIAAKAASQVAPEDPALKKIFGVTREDLYQMGKNRAGNLPGDLPGMAKNPKGSAAAARVMGPENTQRILDAMSEAQKHHALVQGMDPWYIMDPMFQRMAQLIGVDAAKVEYNKMNHLMGMSSPGSEVLTEIPRGTAAYYLDKQGRFGEFVKHLGKAENKRTKRFPADVKNVPGHAYHKTAQAGPMEKYLTSGQMTMKTPKVPMYIQASGVPETGFQTATPVGDAHWSRAVGLADTRNWQHKEGEQVVPKGSVTNPEMSMLAPWWREEIAGRLGLESVPAQARAWGTFSPQTGVTTPIGAPKLELVAKKIMETAHRMGVSPETARDMVLMGKTYAGKKKGGNVKVHKDMDTMRLELTQRKKAK